MEAPGATRARARTSWEQRQERAFGRHVGAQRRGRASTAGDHDNDSTLVVGEGIWADAEARRVAAGEAAGAWSIDEEVGDELTGSMASAGRKRTRAKLVDTSEVSSSLSSLPSQRRCDRDRAVEDEYEDEEAEFERLLRKSSVRDMQEETKGFAEEAKVWDADDSENRPPLNGWSRREHLNDIRKRTASRPRVQPRDVKFASAIRRWQLHKHDRLPSPGSIAQGDVYELADVGRVALEHDRLLRRCFDKLAKHCFERLRLRQAWTDIEAQRRRRLFKSWQHAFFATRMHRIRTLFQFFETWRDVAKENRKFEQLCMIGDTFFELRGKRLVLQRLSDFVSAQKRSFASNRLAKTSQRHRVLSRTFSLWAEARELGEVERSRKETADLFLRAVRLHRGFSTLGRHKRLQIAAQEVRRRARVGLARQTLEIWRARTSEEQQMRLKLLGACVVYDISLCQGAVRQWRRFTLQQRRLHWAARFHDRQLKRKALRGLRLHVVERRRGQDVALKADLFRSERLSLRGLRRLCELVVAQRDERRAVALCEVHLLRKTFGHWYEIASIEGLERKAFHNWVIRSKQVTLRRLELRALESRQRRLHNNLAAMHARESCLRGAFVLWARTAVQIVHERRGLRAAAAMNTLLVMRANFTHWADLVFAKQRLADVYNHVLTMKTVGLCVTAWREHSARWIWMRNEVKLGQLDRTFQAWYELTVDAKYSRHSVQMAAMFRRQRLLETTFFAWQDHLVAVRSERMVLVMAAQHAERRLLCRVMLAWHIQSLRLEVVEPLDERGAEALFCNRLSQKVFGIWAHRAKVTSRLRAFGLNRLRRNPSAASRFASFDMCEVQQLVSTLLVHHGLKARVLSSWKTHVKRRREHAASRWPKTKTSRVAAVTSSLSTPVSSPSPSQSWSGLGYLQPYQ